MKFLATIFVAVLTTFNVYSQSQINPGEWERYGTGCYPNITSITPRMNMEVPRINDYLTFKYRRFPTDLFGCERVLSWVFLNFYPEETTLPIVCCNSHVGLAGVYLQFFDLTLCCGHGEWDLLFFPNIPQLVGLDLYAQTFFVYNNQIGNTNAVHFRMGPAQVR